MKRWLPFLIAVLGALAACTHMPVTSMVRLARVDFTNTDPGELRAAVKLPRAVQPRPNGVSLRIGVRLASGHEEVQDFLLREVSDPSDVLTLNRELDRNTHIFAYRSTRLRSRGWSRSAMRSSANRTRAGAGVGRSPSRSGPMRAAARTSRSGPSTSPPICALPRPAATCRSRATSTCAPLRPDETWRRSCRCADRVDFLRSWSNEAYVFTDWIACLWQTGSR